MINRKLDSFIEQHFSNSKSALLLTGARQTGKTYAIRKYASDKNLNLIEINFHQDPNATSIFKNVQSVKDVLIRISAYSRQKMIPHQTLIFFDEVQKCPETITWIKFLVDEGSFIYALSGSLLGIELKNIRSLPVGYMAIEEVFPLDLQDFFLAVGVNQDIIKSLQDSWENRTSVDPVIHESLMNLVNLYLIVGGMPAVVQTYLDTNDLNAVKAKQEEILTLYKKDISQYDPMSKLNINEIFDLIPSELNEKNKRFILKKLNEGARFSKYENGFLWLKNAGVAIPTYNVEEPVAPLKLNEQRNLFKLFQNDVGLLSSQYENGLALKILSGDILVNFGSMYENLVAQELCAHGHKMYYFNSKKQGELDFLLEMDNEIIPVEVKSGKNYERHNALTNILSTKNYNIKRAWVLCNNNLHTRGNIMYIPIYMLMFITKKTSLDALIYKVDLTGLNGHIPTSEA